MFLPPLSAYRTTPCFSFIFPLWMLFRMHTECVLLLSLVAACSAFPSKHEELRSRNPNHYDDVRYVFVDEANVPNEFKKYIEEIPERLREHYGGTHLKFMRDRWHWQMVRARERAQGQDVRNSTHEEPVPAASASEGSSNNHQSKGRPESI